MTIDLQQGGPAAAAAVESAGRSHTGRGRTRNEDRWLAANGIYAVADGASGAPAGEIAATLVIGELAAGRPPLDSHVLAELVGEANRRIQDLAVRDPALTGMATTLTAAAVKGQQVALAHVGDSRAYRMRDGQLQRLTDDHSFGEELVSLGVDPQAVARSPYRRLLTRALGTVPDVAPDSSTHTARPGDLYLLCTDGLTTAVSEDRIAQTLDANGDIDLMADRLVECALRADGPDNVTVVLFRV